MLATFLLYQLNWGGHQQFSFRSPSAIPKLQSCNQCHQDDCDRTSLWAEENQIELVSVKAKNNFKSRCNILVYPVIHQFPKPFYLVEVAQPPDQVLTEWFGRCLILTDQIYQGPNCPSHDGRDWSKHPDWPRGFYHEKKRPIFFMSFGPPKIHLMASNMILVCFFSNPWSKRGLY